MNYGNITWEQGLIHFYACFHALNIVNSNHETYGKAFYKQLAKNYEIFLANDSSSKINNLWRKETCVYCLEPISNFKFSKGDHIVAGLKKLGIDLYNVPCCKSCNSSKLQTDLIEWLLKNGKNYTDIPSVVISLYIKAKYHDLKFSNKLQESIPEYFVNFLKKLDYERDLEELIKFDTGKNRIYLSQQLDTFHYLQTEPSEWADCKIEYWKMDEKNREHPMYCVTSNREVTPYDDRNPMRNIKQTYTFDNSVDLNHPHKNNCQLCGTDILVNYRIQCDRLQIDMILGSECIKSYQKLKGADDAINGVQTVKKAKEEIFLKKIQEFVENTTYQLNKARSWKKFPMIFPGICIVCKGKTEINEIALWSKGIGVKHEKCGQPNELQYIAHGKDKKFYQFTKQLESVTLETSKIKMKALIKKAELYGLEIDFQLIEIIKQISRKSKNIKKTGLDEFFWT
jgi:hypothetical protein